MKGLFYYLIKILKGVIGFVLTIIIIFLIFANFNGRYFALYKSNFNNNIWFDLESYDLSSDTKKGNYILTISPNEKIIIKNLIIKTSSKKVIKKINELRYPLNDLKYPLKIQLKNIEYRTYIVTGEIIIQDYKIDTKNSKFFKVHLEPIGTKPEFVSIWDDILSP